MKTLVLATGAILLACNFPSFAQSEVPCGQTLDAPIRSGATLKIDSMPADVEIVGTDQESVRVSCSIEGEDEAGTRLKLSGPPTHVRLTITGHHVQHGSVSIRVQVPRRTSLEFQMPAGDVTVDGVNGDKIFEIHAGKITISSNSWNYRNIDASVSIGAVNAQVYSSQKGGFFRSFRKENASGEYRLYAHVTTGQIDLLGRDPANATNPN